MQTLIGMILMTLMVAVSGASAWADKTGTSDTTDGLMQRATALEKKAAAGASGQDGLRNMIGFSGLVGGAYQYENASGHPETDDIDRGALSILLEMSITPTEADEFFFKLGFGAGNGLNTDDHAFILAPWAANLEDDVEDINGRSRDYMLTAWYAHTFDLGQGHAMGITGGIIDATDYLDDNAYANCEYTQFMNEALVNGPVAFLPAYDIGGAVAWEYNGLAVKGVMMHVGENDEGDSYHFYGVQVGYALETLLGEGTYRILVNATSDEFSAPEGEGRESLKAVMLSLDQAMGEMLGVWVRCGWADDKAGIDFQDLYSGGIHVAGKLWGRENDAIGLGYAHLCGGNQDIDRSRVAEMYLRIALNEIFAVTLDAQYLDDQYQKDTGDDVDGWICGIRLTAAF